MDTYFFEFKSDIFKCEEFENDRECYTYFIMWSKTGMKYYGVRYAKGCYPGDLWIKYHTSSVYVSKYREEHGEPDIIQIRKTFGQNTTAARLWEHKVLRRIKAVPREDYLNKNDPSSNFMGGTTAGKTYEEIYGPKKAKELIEIRTKAFIGRPGDRRKNPKKGHPKEKHHLWANIDHNMLKTQYQKPELVKPI